jgi:hypothetical protein
VTCSGTSAVTCDLGDLPSGAAASVAILVSTDEVGTEILSATVTSVTLHPDLTDNVVV